MARIKWTRRLRFSYRSCRVYLVREGRGRWRNYVAGPAYPGTPSGLGGLSMSADTGSLFDSLLDAIWTVREKTSPDVRN